MKLKISYKPIYGGLWKKDEIFEGVISLWMSSVNFTDKALFIVADHYSKTIDLDEVESFEIIQDGELNRLITEY